MSDLDCQTCGVCCLARHDEHVPLTGEDHARLTEAERLDLAVFDGVRCFMRVVDGRCVNLREEGGRFACAIYERRPQVCRDYQRGGPSCEVDRERHGLS